MIGHWLVSYIYYLFDNNIALYINAIILRITFVNCVLRLFDLYKVLLD